MISAKPDQSIAIVILGAGASSRFQGCKLLARAGDKTLLHIAIEKARSCVGDHLYLVTGGWQQDIKQALQDSAMPEVHCIKNPDWQKGIGHSITAAIMHLQNRYSHILFMAGDQIALTCEDLEAIMQHASKHTIIASQYQGQAGIPALFPKAFYSQLLTLDGDQGAKKILKRHSDRVYLIDNPRAAIDIDKREDLAQWLDGQTKISGK